VQTDATPFLAQVQQVTPGFGDALHGLAQLGAAVAPLTAEHVAGEALAVRPDQRDGPLPGGRHGSGTIAQSEREVLLAVDQAVAREHSGGGRVAVGEAERHKYLGADRRHRSPQSVENRDDSAERNSTTSPI